MPGYKLTNVGSCELKRGVGAENAILTNLNTIDCCQTTTNEKRIYFSSNSRILQKHMGSSKILSLKSALLWKIYSLLQNFLLRKCS